MATTSEQRALDLPEHHGRRPAAMQSKIRGASNRATRSHGIGETIVWVVEARVEDSGHKEFKREGLTYVEASAVLDMFELDADQARDLLVGLRQKYRADDDARNGIQPLFDRPAPVRLGWIDGSGRILSDEDFAELQGLERPPSDGELAEEQAAESDRDAHNTLMAPRWLAMAADGDTDGYDQLSVSQISAALAHVDDLGVVVACTKYEASEKNRVGARRALDARAEELSGE